MKRTAIFSLGLALIGGILLVPAKAAPSAACNLGAGDYIVTFKPGVDTGNELKNVHGWKITPKYKYDKALNGFASSLTADEVCELKNNPRVQGIEIDQIATIETDQPNPPSWGLDRIDQAEMIGTTKNYSYNSTANNVTAYVIDTGIYYTNQDFEGRATLGFDYSSAMATALDCNGHGTHVAGTIGGALYGVAKEINLVSVRVLNCNGSGSYSDIIKGIDWVISNHDSATPAVANMSLGGSTSDALDSAVRKLVLDNVTVVVAAGNSSKNASNFSPARVVEAVTVGASDIQDNLAKYSNFGSVLDVIAPGTNIKSDWLNYSTNTISGTSMAAPHVAGVVALYLSTQTTSAGLGKLPDQFLTKSKVKLSSPAKLANTTTSLLYKSNL